MSSQPPSEPPPSERPSEPPPSEPPSGPPTVPPTGPATEPGEATRRPTSGGSASGPPSGPLSEPSEEGSPPSGEPSEAAATAGGPTGAGTAGAASVGAGSTGGGAQPPGGGRTLVTASGGRPPRAWWRRPWMIALVTGVVVAAAVLTVVLTNSDSGTRTEAAPQVALQPVAATGPDPFTGSVAVVSNASTAASSGGTVSATGTDGRTVQGSDPGLYGGSQQTASCDVPRLAEFLNANQDKARAWAAVAGIEPAAIGDYLRSLTSVVLRVDTRVTNHGFANGVATPYQAVLQSGTAVLIDARGLPRVRCACGNPLLPPVLSATPPAYSGTPWPSFKEQDVVAVSPAPSPLKDIVVVDPSSGQSFTHQVSGSPSSSTSGSGTGSRW
ncbi:DUF6777 domain-containing protein [Kitasatospora sp. P5_F3]